MEARLIDALPTGVMVLRPDLTIVRVNPAYERLTGRSGHELIGRHVFEAFPPSPDVVDAEGISYVQRSFERAIETRAIDLMPVTVYPIHDPETGSLRERHWSLASVPILDAAGAVEFLMQRVEDVTDYVAEVARRADSLAPAQWRDELDSVRAQLGARSLDVARAREAERVSARTLEALAGVALGLAGAQTVAELTGVVINEGLVALGAQGGAVALRAGDRLQLVITASLGEHAQATYADLDLSGPLPASVAARGVRVMLADRAACEAFAPEMADVITDTGCEAWVSLPLSAGATILGSLTVGWVRPKRLTPEDMGVVDAMAAQCSQALARIQAREAEQAHAAEAVRTAEVLQRSLLTPPQQPDDLQVEVRYRPATEQAQVGGDWYDSFVSNDGATCLVVGDVTGHDQHAAAVMGQVRNLLRGIAYTAGNTPAGTLSVLDQALQDLDVGTLATAVLGRIEQSPEQRRSGLRTFRWTSAGHPPPVLITPDGKAELLRRPPELLLGFDPASARADHAVELPPGSTLLLYTDGLIERRGADLERGLAWLEQEAAAVGQLPLDELCDALISAVTGSAEDDIAILALRAHPQAQLADVALPDMLAVTGG